MKNRKKHFIEAHKKARQDANQTQEFMSYSLNVSRKTIQNWEQGKGSPDFFQSLEWFRALNVNPFPIYMSLISPYRITPNSSDQEITKGLHDIIDNLSPQSQRALYYLFMGNHGSSAYSVLQLMLCHLHLPLKERIFDARSVLYKYKAEERLGNLICKNNIMPDTENLTQAITKAEESFIHNEYGYNNIGAD